MLIVSHAGPASRLSGSICPSQACRAVQAEGQPLGRYRPDRRLRSDADIGAVETAGLDQLVGCRQCLSGRSLARTYPAPGDGCWHRRSRLDLRRDRGPAGLKEPPSRREGGSVKAGAGPTIQTD